MADSERGERQSGRNRWSRIDWGAVRRLSERGERQSGRSRWSRIDWGVIHRLTIDPDPDDVPTLPRATPGARQPAPDPRTRRSYGPQNSAIDEEEGGVSPTGWGGGRCARVAVLALAALAIFAAGAVIGVVVLAAEPRRAAQTADPQRLLELAERVAFACDYPLIAECIDLCDGNLCCVDEGDGSCEDEDSNCAVYAGCKVLLA